MLCNPCHSGNHWTVNRRRGSGYTSENPRRKPCGFSRGCCGKSHRGAAKNPRNGQPETAFSISGTGFMCQKTQIYGAVLHPNIMTPKLQDMQHVGKLLS